ncbi:MAG: phosphoglucomutase [Deferribacteres bacterium]|nr:phosphoglucomutase [Deferribacteres bacterium]
MKAVIMAGGFGTRIRPLTASRPKPMLPMVNIPLMEHIVNLLKKHGFTELIVLLFFQPEVIKAHFGDGSRFGVSIKYILPDGDYGTAGAVGFSRDMIDETFLVISADLLTDFDLSRMVDYHRKKQAFVTIGLVSVVNPLQFGVVITDREGRIVKFLEKPGWGEVFSDTINTGIYVLEPEVFSYIPSGREFDFSKDLFPLLLSEGKPLYGYKYDGYWRDVGDPDSYREGHYDVFDGKVRIKIYGRKLDVVGRDVRVGDGVSFPESVKFEGVVVLGSGTRITGSAFLKNCSIGSGCVIEEGAYLEGAIVWDNVKIGKNTRIIEAVVCNDCSIGDGAYIGKGAIIAEKCVVGKNAYVKDGVKVWPSKIIEDEAVLTDNLIWGEKWRKRIFESGKVSGLTNRELTPEFVAKLGVAYGSSLKKGASILTGRDSIAASRMLKRAFIGGVLSTGVHVKDLKLIPEPVLRFKLQTFGEIGGVYFKQSAENPEITEIYFYDSRSLDISSSQEKSIERIFSREDFRRVGVYEQGVLEDITKVRDFYEEVFLKSIDSEVISSTKYKVVIDFSHGPSSFVLPELFSKLRCNLISVNATMEKVPLDIDREKALLDLSKMVKALEADCGFWISNDCKRFALVDETGRVINGVELLSLVSYLLARCYSGGLVIFPVSAPVFVEEYLKSQGFSVKRTATTRRSVLEAAMEENAVMAVSREIEFIFPEFSCAFDAMFALVKLLEMKARATLSFSEAFSLSPKGFFVSEDVACPWEKKGMIMRRLVEHFVDRKLSLIDGVKIHFDGGYVLAVPDEEKPVFHLYAEAESLGEAVKLLEELKSLIESWKETP